jgi:hypothetical protein
MVMALGPCHEQELSRSLPLVMMDISCVIFISSPYVYFGLMWVNIIYWFLDWPVKERKVS